MLVANNKGNFTKSNWINYFTCKDGHLIEQAIQQTIATGGQTFWMKSIGVMKRVQVSEMDFEWSVRVK
jgi:hypothetical protein